MYWIFTTNTNEGDNALWAFLVVLVLPALERSCCCRYFKGVGTDGANVNSQAVCILALLGLLALSAPAADARQLKQAAITDADILNFALNLEVRSSTIATNTACNLLKLLLCTSLLKDDIFHTKHLQHVMVCNSNPGVYRYE